MKLAATRLFPLTLMLALALLTFWLERTVREEEIHPSLRRHDPDYIIDNLRSVSYDGRGAIESTLSARKMVHYPDDDSTELSNPRVVETKRDKPRTTISALRGALSQNGEEVFLYDKVLLLREATRARPEVRVETDALHFVRPRSLARSDNDVRVLEESRMLSGRGLEYDMDAGRMALHERVRGQFEPRKKGR
ncbi:MAG: LPS export ABC transporter periplasmic protein LptC [Betaproteobacteria bacterium]|nr:LPS export ABC transporter periplasmic protein LptC [Betaproteobacteria bacterium]